MTARKVAEAPSTAGRLTSSDAEVKPSPGRSRARSVTSHAVCASALRLAISAVAQSAAWADPHSSVSSTATTPADTACEAAMAGSRWVSARILPPSAAVLVPHAGRWGQCVRAGTRIWRWLRVTASWRFGPPCSAALGNVNDGAGASPSSRQLEAAGEGEGWGGSTVVIVFGGRADGVADAVCGLSCWWEEARRPSITRQTQQPMTAWQPC